MNPVRPVGPQGAAHGLGYIQVPQVSAPAPATYHPFRDIFPRGQRLQLRLRLRSEAEA